LCELAVANLQHPQRIFFFSEALFRANLAFAELFARQGPSFAIREPLKPNRSYLV
jgi:hypothetical protein